MTEAQREGGGRAAGAPGNPPLAVDPEAEGPAFDRARMRREVADGLGRTPKELSPKYFYDERGSELFDAITRLEEYYPTRTERALLERVAATWIAEEGIRSLVELGAGSADKTRILLDAIVAAHGGGVYVPVDISGDFLEAVVGRLDAAYPDLDVRPAVADLSQDFRLPDELPVPKALAFLGSTLGNFEPAAAAALLNRVRGHLEPGDRFLLGVDLVKDPAVLEAAYNDAAGVTAAFNRNVLTVLNRELGMDFQEEAFYHRAFWNAEERQIEMHLVAEEPQDVTLAQGRTFHFARGESVRTEISRKYDRPSVAALFADAGLHLCRWETDERGWFALAVGEPA